MQNIPAIHHEYLNNLLTNESDTDIDMGLLEKSYKNEDKYICCDDGR